MKERMMLARVPGSTRCRKASLSVGGSANGGGGSVAGGCGGGALVVAKGGEGQVVVGLVVVVPFGLPSNFLLFLPTVFLNQL